VTRPGPPAPHGTDEPPGGDAMDEVPRGTGRSGGSGSAGDPSGTAGSSDSGGTDQAARAAGGSDGASGPGQADGTGGTPGTGGTGGIAAATGAAADRVLLDAMALAALVRLDAMRASFRLPADVATDADPNVTLKPLGELAELTQLIRDRHPLPAARALAADLFDFAWKETGDGALFAELIHGEPQAGYPVEIYGVFARAGLRHPGAEELIAATTSLRQWRVARADHTRTLAVLNAERRIGLPPHADFDAVLAMTGLGQRPEPWALDLRAVYGITHDVFHLTDWGRAPHRLSRLHADYLRLWVPAWTGNWLEEQVWDVVGELLAVAACLPGAPYDAAAWSRLAAVQGEDGAVPEIGQAPAAGRPADEVFRACYHSTLVTALAATLARTARTATGSPAPVRSGAGPARTGPAPAPALTPPPAAPPPTSESEATS
jgi:hypothetical protein